MNLGIRHLAVIHVAQKQLGLVDQDYRALLYSSAGVYSSRDLDEAGFKAVMATFERLGFEGQGKSRVKGGATWRQVQGIRAAWEALTGHPRKSDDFKATLWKFLGRFVNTPGDVYARLNGLTEEKARHTLAAINTIRKARRQHGKTGLD